MEISAGAILEGTIKSITKFGAFVTLPGGRSGLVHISEIAHSYVADVRDFLTEGQLVKVKVVGIDEAGRINLSMKKAVPPPPRPQNPGRPGGGPGRFEHRGGNRAPGGGGPNRFGGGGPSRGRESAGGPPPHGREFRGAPPQQPAGPADFEARLKQFMQASDSKLSDLKMTEKRNSRRSGHH